MKARDIMTRPVVRAGPGTPVREAKILVAVATRHGATREIAENVATAAGSALTDAEVEPLVVRDADSVHSVEGFDAVVLGSAVYRGHWLEPARKLAESFSDDLRRVPVWLFSSGPVGEQDRPVEELRASRTATTGDWPSIRAWGRDIGSSLAQAVRSAS